MSSKRLPVFWATTALRPLVVETPQTRALAYAAVSLTAVNQMIHANVATPQEARS